MRPSLERARRKKRTTLNALGQRRSPIVTPRRALAGLSAVDELVTRAGGAWAAATS